MKRIVPRQLPRQVKEGLFNVDPLFDRNFIILQFLLFDDRHMLFLEFTVLDVYLVPRDDNDWGCVALAGTYITIPVGDVNGGGTGGDVAHDDGSVGISPARECPRD